MAKKITNPYDAVAGIQKQQSFVYQINGTPVDITGATFDCKVRSTPEDTTILIDLDLAFTIDDAANGAFSLNVSSAVTEDWQDTGLVAVWDAAIILSGERSALWGVSAFVLQPRVSRDNV